MILNSKKLRKLRTNPKLFFKDAIEKKSFWLNNTYKKYLPKKYKGFTQYVIISAVYNVEKYLDDYFKSIINQRLDFKKNIFMILVDDGSSDNSAQIIKKYQKKYPKNIVYLYKENGGQASARNLGLKYMQENHYKTPWVTFTDPDDFLDRNYFYEVDKFLATHQDDDICMIGCNIIFYHEKQKLYKDNHALNFKFKNGIRVRENYNLDNFIQLSAASCFMNIRYLDKLLFDEKLKPNFEDAKFINEYLLENIDLKSAFLPNAKYFYRKREDGSSTLDLKLQLKDYYLEVTKQGYLYLLQKNKYYENFIQNLVLYDLWWQIKPLINSPEKLSILNESEKQEYLNLIDKIFSFIEIETVVNFSLVGYWFFHKVGILNCFKNEKPPFQIAYIEDYDPYKEQILITYYTGDDEDIESILVDGEEVYADYEKIVKYDFLDRVFCYQKRLWVSIPKDAKDKLEVFVNDGQSMVGKYNEYFLDIKDIRKEFQKRLPKTNTWLLMDRDYEADDNAEHLYRYIMQNHSEQKIVFALRKECNDWERLKKEGFSLIEFGSLEFERIVKKASKVISSHADQYLMKYITSRQQFIFLQHGITQNDVSKWLNSRKMDLFITSTGTEYDSIANDYNHYKFGKKEVVLTGFARHDALLKNNKTHTKQIIIMPTWRHYLSGLMIGNSGIRELKDDFKESEYFQKWNLLLNSNTLQKLCEKYSYVIVFNPHPNIIPYLKDFNIPSYIKIANHNESLQELFCNSSLMITDYSSVAFEMAYLNKPVIYYQFDREEFFSSHTLQKGYFDYEKDGFGPVIEDEESLLKELENLLQNDCNPFGIYKDNIDSTFAFKDGKCCERIYKILSKDVYEENNNYNGL
ncbi:CDP-glycerol glycerophosphotransferase family protein [Campylobacter coli]|uniref:CDP-glycerol glycerophosphotransferase family protein n=1 Tax=Campylobacter coli TaxID=195 RepID=UPI0011A47D98|nr:CDP-glycerol glycerophosphotransferase family protein [Campylobacter coli]